MDSFYNYLWDLIIKSFECKNALIEATERLDDSKKRSLITKNFGDLDIWHSIYNNRKQYITKNVRLCQNDRVENVDKVEFHQRFGWTVYGKTIKAYLGKSSIFRNISMEIGHRTYFSGHSSLLGNGLFKIGSYCAVAENLYANVSADFHPFHYPSLFNFNSEVRLKEDNLSIPLTFNDAFEKAPRGISIENDVWIARNVRIFHGVTIGNGSVIAEGALIRENCEPYGIYAGVPGKLVRYRFRKKIIDELLEIRWWNWPYSKIKKNRTFFNTDLTTFDGRLIDLLDM